MKNAWALYALLSAVFAAFTSILAKIGIDGVNSNLATAIRTVVKTSAKKANKRVFVKFEK